MPAAAIRRYVAPTKIGKTLLIAIVRSLVDLLQRQRSGESTYVVEGKFGSHSHRSLRPVQIQEIGRLGVDHRASGRGPSRSALRQARHSET